MKRFAILVTGDAPACCRQDYGQMFQSLLRAPAVGPIKEDWSVFQVVRGEFPASIDPFHGFVVTGSKHDAFGTDPWILSLKQLLRDVVSSKKKLLGVCFGHQVLCEALGGKVGRSSCGWELGVRDLKLNEAFNSRFGSVLPEEYKGIDTISALEVHRDQVLVLPPIPEFEVLASSANTPVEMCAIGDHVLTIQAHPEFTKETVRGIIDIRLADGIISADVAEKAIATLDKPIHDELLRHITSHFLKN